VHDYRAALETILIKRDSQLRHTQVKNVKVTRSITFEQLSKVVMIIKTSYIIIILL